MGGIPEGAREAREGGNCTLLGFLQDSQEANPPSAVSSLEDSAQGTPDRSGSSSISNSTQRDLEVELVLCDSPTKEGDPLVSLSHAHGQTVQSILVPSLEWGLT